MLDVFVDGDPGEFDEHALVFFDDGGEESSGTWTQMVRMLRRLPAGQDFVLMKMSPIRSVTSPVLEHWYDGVLQRMFEGSDDVLEWLDEFAAANRRMTYVRFTRVGH